MKRHHQSSILAYAKKGHLETNRSDEASSDSDLDDYLVDHCGVFRALLWVSYLLYMIVNSVDTLVRPLFRTGEVSCTAETLLLDHINQEIKQWLSQQDCRLVRKRRHAPWTWAGTRTLRGFIFVWHEEEFFASIAWTAISRVLWISQKNTILLL